MGTIFNEITKLGDNKYAEKNRDIELSDYVQVIQPTIEVLNASEGNGKVIRVYCSYEMKPEIINELIDYYQSHDDEANRTYRKFNLSLSEIIDFRGCRTEEKKANKIVTHSKLLEQQFNTKFNLALDTKIARLNQYLNTYVDVNNNEFTEKTIRILTDTNIYDNLFLKDEKIPELNSEFNDVCDKINSLSESKEKLDQIIAKRKRDIVIGYLDKINWNIPYKEQNIKIPQPIIKKTKEVISKSFSSKPFNIEYFLAADKLK